MLQKITNIIDFIIGKKIFISIAALLFTLTTPILTGNKAHFYFFYILIFFSTLFEYNLHQINIKNLKVKENNIYIFMCIFSSLIVITTCYFADFYIFLLLIPFGLISIFYTIPFYKSKKETNSIDTISLRIKDLPYLKIFIIAIVWSLVSTIPFIFKSDFIYYYSDLILVIIEKFLFIFAITLPFDIRDKNIDNSENIKTIPHLFNLKNHIFSVVLLTLLIILQIYHYYRINEYTMLLGLILSNMISILILSHSFYKKQKYYYYGFIDGLIIIQGVILLLIYLLVK